MLLLWPGGLLHGGANFGVLFRKTADGVYPTELGPVRYVPARGPEERAS